ncbi:MAG: hypothetical protein JJ992_25950, partial [Planctomycetes bacterium]|nr:hypothetical protein [Planctomycetota bacterium]
MTRATPLMLLLVSVWLPTADAQESYQRRESWAESMVATRRQALQQGRPIDCADLCQKFWNDFAEMDWFLQDNPHRPAADDDWQFKRDFGWYFAADRDAQAEKQMIRRAIAELQDDTLVVAFSRRLDVLAQSETSPDDLAWLTLYVQICRARREQRLAPVAAQVPCFVFTRHYTLGGSHYAYTEGQSDAQAERHFVPGAALGLARWVDGSLQTETLIDDPSGVIRDPDVSYDGRRV